MPDTNSTDGAVRVTRFLRMPSPASGHLLPGLLLCGAMALLAMLIERWGWLQAHGVGALTLAILLGAVYANVVYPRIASWASLCEPGAAFARQRLLRWAVVLYGLRLTAHEVHAVGATGFAIDALMLGSTFVLAVFLGTRCLRLEGNTAILIGAGSAICGAAAVVAADTTVRGRPEQVAVAVSTVVVFGTLSMLLYPFLYRWNELWHVLPGGADAFGVYVGSTVHEVAQVVVAARSISQGAADTAVITKMVRVMLLAPFLIALSVWLERGRAVDEAPAPRGVAVPWFAIAFIGVVSFNSLGWLPARVHAAALLLDTLMLTTAMAALGLGVHAGAIHRAGVKPLLLGAGLFIWLVVGGAAVNLWVPQLLARG